METPIDLIGSGYNDADSQRIFDSQQRISGATNMFQRLLTQAGYNASPESVTAGKRLQIDELNPYGAVQKANSSASTNSNDRGWGASGVIRQAHVNPRLAEIQGGVQDAGNEYASTVHDANAGYNLASAKGLKGAANWSDTNRQTAVTPEARAAYLARSRQAIANKGV